MPRKPKAKRKPPVSFSDEQLLALLSLALARRFRDYVMILLTFWHGFRASETCSLRESDFDLAAGTVRFKRGKGSEGGIHPLQEFPENPLLDERAAVTWWLGNRGQLGRKGGAKRPAKMRQSTKIVAFSPSDPVFNVERRHFWRLVNGYALAAGIPRQKCKTHALKHTLAKYLVRQGVPLNDIQAYIGWASIATLDFYVRADEEELGLKIGNVIRSKIGLRQVQQGNLFP